MGKRLRDFCEFWVFLCRDIGNFVEYHRRVQQSDPLPFIVVGQNEGIPTSPVVTIEHGPMYDIKDLAIRDALTAEVLLKGHKVNAYRIISSTLVSSTQMRTTIQPCWVEEAEFADEYAPA